MNEFLCRVKRFVCRFWRLACWIASLCFLFTAIISNTNKTEYTLCYLILTTMILTPQITNDVMGAIREWK